MDNKSTTNTVPRMRTIRETARLTDFPEHAIRQLVKDNKIVYVRCGSKALVNLDRFIGYLNGEAEKNDLG